MKKYLITLVLIIAFFHMRFYPCFNLCNYQVRTNNTARVEIPVNNPAQSIAIGALGIGETAAGFTLAEVLITLAVIGVIAALTIPSLITNIQDAQYHTAWKKTYSDLNAATMNILRNNAGSFMGVCSDWDNTCLKNLYLPYLSYAKSCPNGSGDNNCWHNRGVVKTIDGAVATVSNYWYFDTSSYSSLILNNGIFLRFINLFSNCTYGMGGLPNSCGYIEADVNGFNGPNTIGKDIFMVHILPNYVKPFGYNDGQNSAYYCVHYNGMACSWLYLQQ